MAKVAEAPFPGTKSALCRFRQRATLYFIAASVTPGLPARVSDDLGEPAGQRTPNPGTAGFQPAPVAGPDRADASPALGTDAGIAGVPPAPVVPVPQDGTDGAHDEGVDALAQPEEWPEPVPAPDGHTGEEDHGETVGPLPASPAHTAVAGRVTPAQGGARVLPRLPALGDRLPGWHGLWWAALALLVAGGSLFPIFGTYSHLQLRASWPLTAAAGSRIPTGLDGAAFVRVLYPGDAAAIDWINGHVTGMPVLLTSDRGDYRDFATKVTMLTGLPNVISWEGEDRQERYSGQARPGRYYPNQWVDQFESGCVTWTGGRNDHWVTNLPRDPSPVAGTRSTDVETIYNTPDPAEALRLLRQYHVGLIYVGIAERGDPDSYHDEVVVNGHPRVGFDPAGLSKFDRMAAVGQLRIVYRKLGVTIYQVP